MRFAYVAAGAVVLGAAVSESRSVPSSPQRTPKAAKRQTRQAGLREIQPLTFGNSAVMQTSRVLPSTIQNPSPDGISELAMGNHIFPESPAALQNTGRPGVPEELEIVDINPTGVPEYVVMKAPSIPVDVPSSEMLSAPRRYLPSPLTVPFNMIESAGKALPEPANKAFGNVYSSLSSQIQNSPQRLPILTDDPMDALLQELKKIANEQSTPSNPATLPNSPPPPPLLRALSDNAETALTSSSNNTMASAEKDGLPLPLNSTTLLPHVPSPLARMAEITAKTAASNNDTSLSTPSLPTNETATSVVNGTMKDSERATLTTPAGANVLPSNTTSSAPMATLSPPGGMNDTMGNSERATLATPVGANLTIGSPLMDNVTSSVPSNVTDSSQSIPTNTTDSSTSSTSSLPRSALDEE